KLALENYHKYLALTPRPANWDEVNAIVNSLEKPAAVTSANPPQTQNPPPNPTPVASETRAQIQVTTRPMTSQRVQNSTPRANSNLPPRTFSNAPTQVVKVQPEPVIAAAPQKKPAVEPEIELPPEQAPENHGFFHKLNPSHWFASSKPEKKYDKSGLTPLPSPDSQNDRVAQTALSPSNSKPVVENSPTPTVSEKPVKIVESAPPAFPRYLYLSPRKPASGDRVAASGSFTKAREAEQNSQWSDAMEWYRRATESDPTWFEAEYNYGVLAYRLQNYSQALAAYERALAIQSDSVDARYNFALALKAAGYAVDAVNELRKIVASNPDEVRAHLALGNLYAQQLHDNADARKHYLKVLQLDPHNPQATDIRFWLSANPA
ncbi:MAG TPA: tetratricopeptide repeat protein, partial [Verrucomicrobiae bacterium]|nr:tetratricopeptide repeat protein [Verrucomicrobiae bacterium]